MLGNIKTARAQTRRWMSRERGMEGIPRQQQTTTATITLTKGKEVEQTGI